MKKQQGRRGRELKAAEIHAPQIPLSTSSLLALAEELIGIDNSCSILDVKLNVFAPSRSSSINGSAKLTCSTDQMRIWETELSEPDGAPIARVVHTLIAKARALPEADLHEIQPQAKDKKPLASLEERREIIARAACNVISKKGFAASSIREIADAAGMHVPTMYQYVGSKDEVLELVYRWVISRVKENIADALSLPVPPKERLIAVTLKLLEDNELTPRHTGVLNRELRSLSKSARGRVLADYAEIMKSVADIIAEGTALGEFHPVNPTITANFIDALCDMWALRQFAVGQFSVEEYRNEILRYLKKGLFVPEAQAE